MRVNLSFPSFIWKPFLRVKWKDTSYNFPNMEKLQNTWPNAKFYFEVTFSLQHPPQLQVLKFPSCNASEKSHNIRL